MNKAFVIACIAILSACAANHKSAKPDAAVLASIPAELRMMGAESTWVAKGIGYELVTRAKVEVVPLMSQLDDQSRYFEKMFAAPPSKVIAAVRRVGPPGTPPEASAPVPFDVGPVVEVVVIRTNPIDPKKPKVETAEEREERFQSTGPPERFSATGPTAGIVKAWLAARASSLTGKPATPAAASATTDDPRVPAWAEDALPNLAVETGREDTVTARLAMQIDSLYPIHSFLTMPRPGAVLAGRGGRGDATPGGQRGGGGGGGFGGGMSGGRRGGMGGMSGGGSMGRGGSRGGGSGGSGRGDGGRGNLPLSGPTLFAAQAIVFARYLAVREGPAFVGTLVDAQMSGKSVNAVFDAAQMVPSNIERLDIEFHRWLIDRAAHGR